MIISQDYIFLPLGIRQVLYLDNDICPLALMELKFNKKKKKKSNNNDNSNNVNNGTINIMFNNASTSIDISNRSSNNN